MATTQVSLDDYLHTDYEPDCDFVDGQVEERYAGEFEHSAVLGFLVRLFAEHESKTSLDPIR